MKALFKAKIFHKRHCPKVNEFTYGGYYIRFDISEVEKLKSTLFSVNRFNLMSFYNKDHGHRNEGALRGWVDEILVKSSIDYTRIDKVELATFPRVLGYVFNPVSFWYCYAQEELKAIICEVNNTFGESHNYVIDGDKKTLPKRFHVSPFFDVAGYYNFDFTKENLSIINHTDNDHNILISTSIQGAKREWSDKNILFLFLSNPIYTFAVVFLIHYQALKLLLKKIKFYTKPELPKSEITYEHTIRTN